jgi:hypothetical protein
MTGGEDDTCVSFGCDREALNDEHCEPCRTAFEAGYHKAQDDGGVRGREEIQEKKLEISRRPGERVGKPVSDYTSIRQGAYEEALDWVLGEVDDL